MKRLNLAYVFVVSAAMLLEGCAVKSPKAAEEREAWLESLNDSIALYREQSVQVESALDLQRKEVENIISEFTYVNNPREVEGYYLYKGWEQRYRERQPGLLARITEDERLELTATYVGEPFNQIGVEAGTEVVKSQVVPHDQALNYRIESDRRSTVSFSGSAADSIGEFIALNKNKDIKLLFYQGKCVGVTSLGKGVSDMIGATWQLYAAQKKMHQLEKELTRLSGKTAACRRLMDSADKNELTNQHK